MTQTGGKAQRETLAQRGINIPNELRWRWNVDPATAVKVVILGGGRGTRLDPLTRMRSKPAVPLAGKYRLIDVALSNAIHSDMVRIFILTQFNSVSLHRHIHATYKFAPFSRGFVEVLAAQQTPGDERWFQGTADAVRRNMSFISELRGDLVLILSGDHLYRMDYRLMLFDHLEHEADVTLPVFPCAEDEIGEFGAVRVDESGRVVEFREKPVTAAARAGLAVPDELRERRGVGGERPYLASMGIYLCRQDVLNDILKGPRDDFGKDIFPEAVDRYRVQAHFFEGYWRDIGTIGAFYDAHMDLLEPDPPFDFLDPTWSIFTHPRFLPSSRVTGTRIDHSLLADGANIEDSEIDRSIIGIRSRIRRARIRRSLLMGLDEYFADDASGPIPVGIGPGSVIENAIVDKNVRVGRDVHLANAAGVREAEGEGWVIRNGIIVLPKGTTIPDGTRI